MSTTRSSRIISLVTAAAAAAVLLCACSTGSRQAPDATVTPPPLDGARAPVSLAAAMSALPLAAYEPSGALRLAVRQAVGILEVTCMKQRGYHRFRPAPAVRSSGALPGGGGPFGYVNAGYAARRGFGLPARTAPAEGVNPAETRVSIACLTRAQDRVFRAAHPLSRTDQELLFSLYLKSESEVIDDQRVEAATRAWAACMKRDGFNDGNPASLASESWPGPPSAREIATAKADAACTSSVDLAGIYFAALAGYERELAAPHAKALAAVRRANQSQTARTAQIVAAGGS
jgi:hypothetical protein